ncbi:MAG: SWIM zinc finger family protein [Anaerolineaceae bacterium]|nr:SWIM zinc finger family protein [Anaerolineaceae bacterium]
MDSGMIGKIEKAKRYAAEGRERFQFQSFTINVEGENNTHCVNYRDGEWACDCNFFQSRGRCSHTMALEFILEGMLSATKEE